MQQDCRTVGGEPRNHTMNRNRLTIVRSEATHPWEEFQDAKEFHLIFLKTPASDAGPTWHLFFHSLLDHLAVYLAFYFLTEYHDGPILPNIAKRATGQMPF